MSVTEQELNIGFWVFVVLWFGGIAVLAFRSSAKGKAYLRRLPPVRGIPLDMYMNLDDGKWNARGGTVWKAYRQEQSDPEIEGLRRAAWRQRRYLILWGFGFPIVVWGAFFLLVAVGYIR